MALDWLPYCACGHAATAHRTTKPLACTGRDSYGFACLCPSFALCQEDEEQAQAAGEMAAVEARLAELGLNPKARQ